jgi:hypothetical protein
MILFSRLLRAALLSVMGGLAHQGERSPVI